MKTHTVPILAVAALVVAGISSCSMNKAGGGLSSYQAYDRPAKLPGNPSAVRVKVSLSKQRVYVMEGADMLMAMPVSIGAPVTPTPTGNFRITDKKHRYRAATRGHAQKGEPMPYWCGFKPAYGFHTGWVKHHPCTNGCIRMHENLAPKFFRIVSVGTPVSIAYRQPEDAEWASMPLPPDAGPLPDYDGSIYAGDGYFTRHKTPEYE